MKLKRIIYFAVFCLVACVSVQAAENTKKSQIVTLRKALNTAHSAAVKEYKRDPDVAKLFVELKEINAQIRKMQQDVGLVPGIDSGQRSKLMKQVKSQAEYKRLEGQKAKATEAMHKKLLVLSSDYKVAYNAFEKAAPKSSSPVKLPKTQTTLTPKVGNSAYASHEPTFEEATKLWFRYPSRSWLEAVPIGNGSFGAMIFGGVDVDVLQFNHDTIWTAPNVNEDLKNQPYPDKRGVINEIRELIFSGKPAEAHTKVREDLILKYNVGAYQPFGELKFDYDYGVKLGKESIGKYQRWLDMETGVATTSFTIEGTEYTRDVFVAEDQSVIVVRMRAEGPGTISSNMNFFRPAHFPHQEIKTETVSDNVISMAGTAHREVVLDYATSFEALAAATTTGGTVSSKGGVLSVQNAKEMVVLIAGSTNFNHDQPFEPLPDDLRAECQKLLSSVQQAGVDQVMQQAVDGHSEIFGRVDIQLGAEQKNDMSIKERVKRSREMSEAEHDPYLTMQLFHMGRYLLITSSRPGSMAANLRGIWNSELKPSWDSDYHHDINVQMSYWSAENTNMTECHEPLFDLLKMAKPRGERVASEMLGCRGVFLPLLHGIYMTAYPPTPPASMWAMGGPWNATHIMEHYRFAGDKDYLRDVSYDLLKDYVLFCLDWLVVDPRTGKLVGGPDYSPETAFSTRPDGQKGDGWGNEDMGCAMTQQITWQVFTDFLEASEILGIQDEVTKEVQETMPRLAGTRIGADGTIMEWSGDYPSSEPDHRHISHMWAFYPGNQFHIDNAPDMLEAGKKTLDIRTDTDRSGKKVTWSNLYYINFYARFGMGDQSLYWINNLNRIRGFNMNLMGSQGQVQDCNYGYPSGIAEMLLQSHTGEIKLLPALPTVWAEGSVSGLVARGGFEVSMKWQGGKLVEATILSKLGNSGVVNYQGRRIEIDLKAGEQKAIQF